MEPVEIRTDEVLLWPWRPSGTDAVHRARQDPMIGLRPGVSGGTECTAASVPQDLAAPGHEVAPFVRRQAAVSGGGDRPTPAAGPVTLRPPGGRDIASQVAAYRDADVIRWYGVVADGVAG